MKINFYSDLHNEFELFEPVETDADVVVIAGDAHYKRQSVLWAADAYDKPVVMVAGNHEHYGRSEVLHNIERMREQAAETDHVHFLERDEVVIDGTRFLGCTLWTDLGMGDRELSPGEIHPIEAHISDFRQIRFTRQFWRLRPRDVISMHRESVAWLREALARPHDGATVVVTHHAPSRRSFTPGHPEKQYQPAYATPLDDLVAESGAALWIHGHLHHSSDYYVGDTHVACNPRGYAPHHLNRRFDPGLVFDVGLAEFMRGTYERWGPALQALADGDAGKPEDEILRDLEAVRRAKEKDND